MLSDEDVHKCGRCQSEFSTLEAFIQHKLHHGCKRVEAREASSQDVNTEVRAVMFWFVSNKNYAQER